MNEIAKNLAFDIGVVIERIEKMNPEQFKEASLLYNDILRRIIEFKNTYPPSDDILIRIKLKTISNNQLEAVQRQLAKGSPLATDHKYLQVTTDLRHLKATMYDFSRL